MLHDLITNWVLIIALCAWMVAQLVKLLVALARGKGLDLSFFISSGGMPSAHSAMVCALATAIAIKDGFGSAYFAIAVILALVVTYDAAGVRHIDHAATTGRLARGLCRRRSARHRHAAALPAGEGPAHAAVGAARRGAVRYGDRGRQRVRQLGIDQSYSR